MTADFDAKRIDLAREGDFRLGEILVRPSVRQFEAGGDSQTLQPRIMQVLVALARRQGQVVSRDELTLTCWEGRAVGEDAINRCIQQIRKLGETTNAFEVETIPRVGYRIMVADGPVHAAPETNGPASGLAASGRLAARGRWLIAATVIGFLLVGGLSVWWNNLNSKQVTVSRVTTLAVLPFDALDDDPTVVRMASVIPRDMADVFSRGGISITASAQSMTYTGDAKARAAAELGADLLLDGTVRREDDQAHVSVRLFHAERGVTLWSETLVADLDDPFVDDRLAWQAAWTIYWTVPLRILNSDRANAVEEARAFLRIMQTAKGGDQIGAREAAVNFALSAPDLVNARAAAAIETMTVLALLRPEERPEALAFARKEAETTMRLDPREGSSYHAAAAVAARGNWAEGIAIVRKGMEVDPHYTRLRLALAYRLLATGAMSEALSSAKRARADEPLSAVRVTALAEMLLASGDIVEMDRVLDAHEQVWPNDAAATQWRLRAAQWMGDPDVADALLDRQAPPGSAAAASLKVAVERALIAARRSGKDEDIAEVGRLCSRVADEALKHPPASTCMLAGGVLGQPDISFAAADLLIPRIHNSPDGEDAWLLFPELDLYAHADELFMPWMTSMRPTLASFRCSNG